MTLGLAPQRAFANDVNPHSINVYKWIREGWRSDVEMVNDETVYYQHRERFNELVRSGQANSSESAQLFYYMNRTGYNGLCRFNNSGEFNVPFGRYKRISYRTDFSEYSDSFRQWNFASLDFEDVPLERGDFVYADPPYDVPFTQYSKGGFSWEDQVRLAEVLARHRGPIVISNQATPRIIELYTRMGFEIRFLDAPRRISCTGDRSPAREVLVTKGV